jgi:hypothetical protein
MSLFRPIISQEDPEEEYRYSFNLGARRGWVVNATSQPLYPQERPVVIVREAVWRPGPVWTDAGNLSHTRIRSLDRPSRSQSQYRLSYPGRQQISNTNTNYTVARFCLCCSPVYLESDIRIVGCKFLLRLSCEDSWCLQNISMFLVYRMTTPYPTRFRRLTLKLRAV